jgi:hypothetical protein
MDTDNGFNRQKRDRNSLIQAPVRADRAVKPMRGLVRDLVSGEVRSGIFATGKRLELTVMSRRVVVRQLRDQHREAIQPEQPPPRFSMIE